MWCAPATSASARKRACGRWEIARLQAVRLLACPEIMSAKLAELFQELSRIDDERKRILGTQQQALLCSCVSLCARVCSRCERPGIALCLTV